MQIDGGGDKNRYVEYSYARMIEGSAFVTPI